MENQNKILNVNTAISYQEGSVVSREIIKKQAGNITIFAFDAGQGLSEHKTPFDALAQITDGKAEITVSGIKYELLQGDMLLMPANEPHELKAQKRFKMILTMIK